jgi:hypothetical protein
MKHGKIIAVAMLMFIVFCCVAQAQYLDRMDTKSPSLSTGDLRTDLMMMPDAGSLLNNVDSSRIAAIHTNKYSPLRAGLYSAVIPGAGQFYTKSYLQSALFAGAEVALWIFYSKYESKGDQKTQEFQNYADGYVNGSYVDAKYSVVRYVEWIQKYYPLAWMKEHIFSDADYNKAVSSYDAMLNGSTSSHPWDQVNWSALNDYEGFIGGSTAITGFSHKLPFRPDQQYYELIGKYPQFAGGWDDAEANGIDASAVVHEIVSPNFLSYRNMRGDANNYYNIASTMAYVLVANHVLGALEAAWNAAHLNSQLHASSSVQPRNVDGYHVELAYAVNLQVEF